MPRAKDRPPAFQLYPRDLLSSSAWAAMTLPERGGYVALLCHAWLQRRQGWLQDNDELLARLSGMQDQWPAAKLAISRAFDTSKPGWWVQRRLVETRRNQIRFGKRQKAAADARWKQVREKKALDGIPPAMPRECSASASATAVEEDSKDRTLVAPDGAESVIPASKSTPKATRVKKPEAEPPGFPAAYALFPRRDGRRAAAKAFSSALRRNPSYTPDDLLWAVGRFAERCRSEGREAQFTPMPATWLNQDRFREFFDESEDHSAQTNGRSE